MVQKLVKKGFYMCTVDFRGFFVFCFTAQFFFCDVPSVDFGGIHFFRFCAVR